MTRFEQFQQNVQQWSTDRGIYEHSTALAQALKAVSEVGELADAVIKNDRAALIDAIGDVAVCLVNLEVIAKLPAKTAEPVGQMSLQEAAAWLAWSVGELAADFRETLLYSAGQDLARSRGALLDVCLVAQLDFDDCCEAAWQQIKDRKGRMVAGGAFVKDGIGPDAAGVAPSVVLQNAMPGLAALATAAHKARGGE